MEANLGRTHASAAAPMLPHAMVDDCTHADIHRCHVDHLKEVRQAGDQALGSIAQISVLDTAVASRLEAPIQY